MSRSSPLVITVRAPAKINLHLGVGAPREDGMHPLLTVYQAIGLYDDVTVRDAESWGWASPWRTTWRTTASRSTATTSTAPPTCWPRTTASSARRGAHHKSIPSPAAWRAGRPTPPPRWSRWTGSGE